ncbi:FAD-binding and (Fe-S)-binding domain-containing protein [Gordonia sinesedis]
MRSASSAIVAALTELGLQVDDTPRRLSEYSYDASNYRVRPLAVVFPRTASEVADTARACHRQGVPLVARGGGTSMAGNAIGRGVVLDFSRHLNRVREVDVDSATAVADTGVVLTSLARQVRQATGGALTFAPDPSSASRATLGGAIGNDACGNHSVRYGRTTEHVEELSLVTADGLCLTATRTGLSATDPDDAAASRRADEMTAAMRDLAAGHLAALRTELATIPRQVSGYHLAHLLPENGFDVARALVGSEGTCAIVVSARVRLVPAPTSSLLVCVGYPSVVDAARDVPAILPFAPSAVEGVDRAIVDTMAARRGPDTVAGLPDGAAWLFIDVDEHSTASTPIDVTDKSSAPSDSAPGTAATAIALLAELRAQGRMIDATLVDDPARRAALWRVREDGAGLSARLVGPDGDTGYESWPGWEDAAVAPDRLAGYLDDFTDLMDRYHLTGVMYGHFGAGCMHVRITFDLRSPQGRTVMERFCTEAAKLVVRHGGSLSGEHGDGRARSALLPIMYSPEMRAVFAEFKRIWDPAGRLNPAGITDPPPITADLALDGVPNRRWHTAFRYGHADPTGDADADIASPDGDAGTDPFVRAVQGCIGVGRCRTSTGGVMCPSYRATRDEKDSTRGRARVLQDMLRTAPTADAGWRSADVTDALDLCLSCKACSSDCPTGVDMATYKSEFLHHHYRRRLRPRSHYSLGWMPAWLPAATALAPMVNRVLDSPLAGVAARAAGLDPRRTMPRLASRRDRRTHLTALPPRTATSDVVLVVDSFTRAFRPAVAAAAARILGGAGADVGSVDDVCCGLTWISTGQLDRARKVLSATADALDDGTETPIVVAEPSCAAALRTDLPDLLDTPAARRVAARVRSFAAHLPELLDAGWRPAAIPDRVTLQTHCHEYATFGATTGRSVLERLGVAVRTADGCCGVAGNFGFERGHYDVAVAVAEQSMAPALRADPTAPVVTDGFSCAMSVEHLAATEPQLHSRGVHLAELLADARSWAPATDPPAPTPATDSEGAST